MSPDMLFGLLWKSLLQTLHMVAMSGLVGSLIGRPIVVVVDPRRGDEVVPGR